MAAFETSRSAPFGATTAYRVISGISAIIANAKAWNEARITRNELSALSDRELKDIGLARHEIASIGR